MNTRLKKIARDAGYAAPELAGRMQTFALLLLLDVVRELRDLHMTQGINNQNHPAAYHDGIDACIETIGELYGDDDESEPTN